MVDFEVSWQKDAFGGLGGLYFRHVVSVEAGLKVEGVFTYLREVGEPRVFGTRHLGNGQWLSAAEHAELSWRGPTRRHLARGARHPAGSGGWRTLKPAPLGKRPPPEAGLSPFGAGRGSGVERKCCTSLSAPVISRVTVGMARGGVLEDPRDHFSRKLILEASIETS